MPLFTAFSILIVISALFAYVNYRFIKLPGAIGLMFLALGLSLTLVLGAQLVPDVVDRVRDVVQATDLSELLLGSMLGFMLFAGAIHIRFSELKQEKWSIMLLSTVSVVLSTLLVGFSIQWILGLFGIAVPILQALLFGALISPTDPIAVLGILKSAKVPRSLEMKIAGESLFNDGVAVVVFLTIFAIARDPETMTAMDVATLFAREALGGIVLGFVVGYIGFLMMHSIDNYKVEVLITIAIVMGGYSLAHAIDVSGPLLSFRWTHVFASDGAAINSVSTLRFRGSDEITRSLEECGYRVDEVRDTPDRPGRELVFIASRMETPIASTAPAR